jgi:hypothetical protein
MKKETRRLSQCGVSFFLYSLRFDECQMNVLNNTPSLRGIISFIVHQLEILLLIRCQFKSSLNLVSLQEIIRAPWFLLETITYCIQMLNAKLKQIILRHLPAFLNLRLYKECKFYDKLSQADGGKVRFWLLYRQEKGFAYHGPIFLFLLHLLTHHLRHISFPTQENCKRFRRADLSAGGRQKLTYEAKE